MISIDKKTLDKIDKFVSDVFDTNKGQYKRRGQSKEEKIKQQIKIGKIGEFAVYKHLKKTNNSVTKPDLKIYSAKNKSWDADLFCDDAKIHVKTQTLDSANSYGCSWIWQMGGRGYGHTDPIVCGKADENDYVAFVVVDEETNKSEIKALFKANLLIEKNLFEEPKLKNLRGTKVAVYYDTLTKVLKENIIDKI